MKTVFLTFVAILRLLLDTIIFKLFCTKVILLHSYMREQKYNGNLLTTSKSV